MADDIRDEVKAIFKAKWTERDGAKVPDSADVKLANDAVKLKAAVLYADLAESTAMVNERSARFSAEVYKTFLISACRIIRRRGGVMAVFIGGSKRTNAAKAALNLNWCVLQVVNAEFRTQYPNYDHVVRHAVGVDTSDLLVARAGIRGSNDLVWVGRAANYAAKLCTLREDPYVSWITVSVYDNLNHEAKFRTDGRPMWEKRHWTAQNVDVYRSSWWWKP